MYDEVFFTQLIDDNLANYDGCIRSGIFRGYDRPITVDITPVLRLTDSEKDKVRLFAVRHKLSSYQHVVLFEFAPQSAQLAITTEMAIEIARQLTANGKTAVILSSANKINSGSVEIIDGSEMTLRETAELSHYCTLLIGCSSGISWITTSDAGKPLPMLQILDPYSPWVNPMSRDFERFGLASDRLIEIYENDMNLIVNCALDIMSGDFKEVKKKYFKPLPLHFIGTSRGIYNMLCFLQFKAIARHIRINISVFGYHPLLIKAIVWGLVSAPFKLIKNLFFKYIVKKFA